MSVISGLITGGWNALRMTVSARTFASLPSADTEVSAADRHAVDLTHARQASIVAHVQTAGTTGVACIQYTLDNASWFDLTNTISLASTGLKKSAVMVIPLAARTLVTLRLIGRNGNGVESPAVLSGVSVELM